MRFQVRRRIFKNNHKKRKLKNIIFLLAIFYLFISVFFMLDKKLSPSIAILAEAKSKQIALSIINNCLNENIESSNINYDKFINVVKNSNGDVKALETKMNEINKFKAQLSIDIYKELNKIKDQSYYIPIGNASNLNLFFNKGIKIPLKFVSVGDIEVEFESKFEAQGINQTKHEIVIVTKTHVVANLPKNSIKTQIKQSIPVVQTIIVGSVPGQYTNIEGTTGETPDVALQFAN